MKPAGFIGRWVSFLKLIRSAAWSPRTLTTHTGDFRDAQRRAARAAFLSDLPTPGQRRLAGPHFGDTQ